MSGEEKQKEKPKYNLGKYIVIGLGTLMIGGGIGYLAGYKTKETEIKSTCNQECNQILSNYSEKLQSLSVCFQELQDCYTNKNAQKCQDARDCFDKILKQSTGSEESDSPNNEK